MQDYFLAGTEFLLEMTVLELDDGGGCITFSMYLMSLQHILENG